jgi:inner membrane protein
METTTVLTTLWQKSKLLVKGIIIGLLVLLLLIPTYFVQNLISEREARQKEAFNEVSSKWAGRQNITGPVLVIPYHESKTDEKNSTVLVKKLAYFLPDKLDITSSVSPQKKYRGIYQVMLFSADISITGKFSPLPLQTLKLTPADLFLNEAYICTGISDAKGLKEEVQLKWNDSLLQMIPSAINNGVLREGFLVPVNLAQVDIGKEINFSTRLLVNGSQELLFTPVGKETSVEIQSPWPDPSFSGSQLPDTSSINAKGFMAKWKSLSHTRNFPQAWKESSYEISNAAFGTYLFIPVNNYQKTLRSVKYAVLCILLTFTAFFLIETANKKSVHPIQYVLIGFALILFYTLLLSFSEYIGFNAAYSVSAAATIGLITWFVKGILGSFKLSALLSVVLILMYSYVFTILQLQDYALLMGSLGLFLTLAVVMHFSKKVQW